MASNFTSLVPSLILCTILLAMVEAMAVSTTQSDQTYYNSLPPPAECAYPCLPTPPSPPPPSPDKTICPPPPSPPSPTTMSPPAAPGTYYYPPPYYPGPGFYPPPFANLLAPPPPNPILPYFPFYYKNPPPPPGSFAPARPLKASLLLVVSLLWFILL